MNKYDIKLLCSVPPPYGGITIHIKRLIDRLTKDGFSVGAYYTPECIDENIIMSDMYDLEFWDNDAHPIIKIYRHILRFFNRIKEVTPYKLVHSHSGLHEMFLIWVIKNLCKKQVVVTLHNSMVEEYYRTTSSFNKFFMKRLVKQDITWIAVSEQARTKLLRLPLNFKNEIQVIPAYIPSEQDLSVPLSNEMQSYINSHSRIIVFYAHSFMLHDGVDVYGFDAVFSLYSNITNQFNNIGLVLCLSDGHETEKIEELHKIAKRSGIDEKLFWQIGAINNMQTLWSQTDVYVRPTNTDGDSVAVREALDMGVKVVASNVCYRPDGVVTYQYGNNDDLYEKVMIEVGKEKQQNTSPQSTYYSQLVSVYKNALAKIIR